VLVLTRRSGESVMIGDQVVVTVVEVRGDVVRLGIQAPREVRVHREEVYRAVGEANAAAAKASEDDISRLAAQLRSAPPAAPAPPDAS
jgi:carbon storage regulator